MSNFTQQNNYKSNGYSNNEYKESSNQLSVLAAENLELRNRIHQSNETIFDLQASMITLEAESKFQVENELKKINAESIFKQRDFDVLNQEHQNTLRELAALKQAMRTNSANVSTQPVPALAPVVEMRSDTKNGTTPKNSFTAHNNSRFNQTTTSSGNNTTPHTTSSSSSSSHTTPSTTERTVIKLESDTPIFTTNNNTTTSNVSAQDALLTAATQRAIKSALRILSTLNGQYQALLLSLSSTEHMISGESANRLFQLMNKTKKNEDDNTTSSFSPSFSSTTLTPLKKSNSNINFNTAVSTPQSSFLQRNNNSTKSKTSTNISATSAATDIATAVFELNFNFTADTTSSDRFQAAQREVLMRLTELGRELKAVMEETICTTSPHYTLNMTSILMTTLTLAKSLHSTLLLATPTAAALIGDTTTSVEEGSARGSGVYSVGQKLKDVFSREVEVNGGKGLRGLFHVRNNSHNNNNSTDNNTNNNNSNTKHSMTLCLELLISVLIVLNADTNLVSTTSSSLHGVDKEVFRSVGGDLRSKFDQVATNKDNDRNKMNRSGSDGNSKNNLNNTTTTTSNSSNSNASSGAKRKLSTTNTSTGNNNQSSTNNINNSSNQPPSLPLPSFFLGLKMPGLSDTQKMALLGPQYAIINNTTSGTNNTNNTNSKSSEFTDCSLFASQFTTLFADVIKSAYYQAQNSKFILAAGKVRTTTRLNAKEKKKLSCIKFRTELFKIRALPLSLLSSDVEVIVTLFEVLSLLINHCGVGGRWINNSNNTQGGVRGSGIGCDLLPLLLTNREDTKTINSPAPPEDESYTLDTLQSDHHILTQHALPALVKVIRDTTLPLSLQRGALQMLCNAVCGKWSLYRRLVTDQQTLIPLYDPYADEVNGSNTSTSLTTSDTLDGQGGGGGNTFEVQEDVLMGTNRTHTSLLVALSARLEDKDACYTGVTKRVGVSRGGDQGSGCCDVEMETLEYKIQIAEFLLQLVKKYNTTAVNWIAGRTAEEVFEGVVEVEVEEEVRHHRMDVEDRNTTPLSSAAKRSNTNSSSNNNNQHMSDSQQGALLRRTHSIQSSTTSSNTNSASKPPKTPTNTHNSAQIQTPQTATTATPSRSGVFAGATFPVFKPFTSADHARPQRDVVNAIIVCLKDHIRVLDTTVSCHLVCTEEDAQYTPLSSARERKMEELLVTLCHTLIELLDTIAAVMVDEMEFETLISQRSEDLNCALCRAFVDNLHSSLLVKSSAIRHLGEE